MRMTGFLAAAAALAMLASPAWAQDKVVKLTSLEWPPYAGEKLPSQGAVVEAARQAFASQGYRLDVDFFPWQRAVALAKDGSHDGYFPEYFMQTDEWLLSESIGTGPLGLVESKAKPITWQTLADLKPLKIGVVSGYVNTVDFDAMVEKKELSVDAANDDATNLRKLVGGRLDAAVIDSYVLNYMLGTDPKLADAKGVLQMNAKLLEEKTLHIAFAKDKKAMAEILSAGLKKVEPAKIVKDYLALNKF